MYCYFVSYSFFNSKIGRNGLGCCELKLEKPITHFNEITEIANNLEKSDPISGTFTITNFQLLRVEDESKKQEPNADKLKYYYFVYYSVESYKLCQNNSKCCEIKRDKPITHSNEILEIADNIIKADPNLKKCAILNFQLLRVENETN